MIPIKLVLENFISHLYSSLDFSQFNAALVVGSFEGDPRIANGVGKTALFAGIGFALYGKSKFSKKTKIIKHGKQQCKVEFQFEIGGETYRIIRTLEVKSGIIGVNFAKNIDGEWNDKGLTGDTSTITNSKIIEVIGMNYDVFTNVVYFSQNEVSGFTSATASKRKDILKEALQIGIWDEYQMVAKNYEKSLLDKLKILEERIKTLGDIQSLLESNNNDIGEKNKELNLIQEEILKLEEAYGDCVDEISHLESIISHGDIYTRKVLEKQLKSINDKLNMINTRKNVLMGEVKNNNTILANSSNDISGLKKKLVSLYKDILFCSSSDVTKQEYKSLTGDPVPIQKYSEESLKEKMDQRAKYHDQLKLFEHDLNQLTSLEVGSECPACLTVFDNVKGVKRRRKSKQQSLESAIVENKNIIKKINKDIVKEKEAIEKHNKSLVEVERTHFMIAKLDTNLSNANNGNKKIQDELKLLSADWKKFKGDKSRTSISLDNLNNVSELNNNLQKFEESKEKLGNKITNLKEKMLKISVEIGNKEGYKEELERRNTEKNVLVGEKNEVIGNLAIYSKLTKAFGKDGIQSIIMENITEDLRQYSNNILKNIYYKPITVDFITQKQMATGKWKEDFDISIMKDGDIFDFGDMSGGEQVRISIAIRLALSQLLMRRVGTNVNFLLFDEVDQSLDRHGLEALADVIHGLSNEFKILVITHNEYMKDRFEHVITVHMGPTGSILL